MFEGLLSALSGTGLGSAIGSLGSGILSFFGGQSQNEAAAGQADTNRLWQQNMSNTAYQRATADMKAAGLNPMLAYSQGGATTPGGAVAPVQNALGNAVSSAQAGASVWPQIQNLRAVTDKTIADKSVSETQAIVNEAVAAKTLQDTKVGQATADSLRQDIERKLQQNLWGLGQAEAQTMAAEQSKRRFEAAGEQRRYEGGFYESQAKEMMQRARAHAAGATLDELGVNRAKAEAGMYGRTGGQLIPYGTSLLHGVSSAARAAASFAR